MVSFWLLNATIFEMAYFQSSLKMGAKFTTKNMRITFRQFIRESYDFLSYELLSIVDRMTLKKNILFFFKKLEVVSQITNSN